MRNGLSDSSPEMRLPASSEPLTEPEVPWLDDLRVENTLRQLVFPEGGKCFTVTVIAAHLADFG